MYLPKGKYSKPKYTKDGTFTGMDGKPYTGYFFTDLAGNAYAGTKPGKDVKPLLGDEEGFGEIVKEPNIPTSFNKFTSEHIMPTEKDYENGFFKRCFLQDTRNTKIIEVKEKKYKYLLRLNHIVGVKINWILEQPVENIEKGPYIYFGSKARNKETVQEQKIIKDLDQYIINYGEFIK